MEKRPLVLVIDDEPDILRIVTFRLKKLGYEIYSAVNGEDGLNLIKKLKPDLVFLDIRMPILSGYDVCEIVKKDEELKSIPIVFLTATTTSTVIEKTIEYKADDYLIKPFEPEALLGKVKKFLG